MEDEQDGTAEEEPDSSSKRKRKKESLTSCRTCGRQFYTIDGFRKHLKMHLFAGELAVQPPD